MSVQHIFTVWEDPGAPDPGAETETEPEAAPEPENVVANEAPPPAPAAEEPKANNPPAAPEEDAGVVAARQIAALKQSLDRTTTIYKYIDAAKKACDQERESIHALAIPALTNLAPLHAQLGDGLAACLKQAHELKWQVGAAISEAEIQGSSAFQIFTRTAPAPGGPRGLVSKAILKAIEALDAADAARVAANSSAIVYREFSVPMTQTTVRDVLRDLQQPRHVTPEVAQRIFLLRMFASDAACFYDGLVRILAQGSTEVAAVPLEVLRAPVARTRFHHTRLWVGGYPPHVAIDDMHATLRRAAPIVLVLLNLQTPPAMNLAAVKDIAAAVCPGRAPTKAPRPVTDAQSFALTQRLQQFFGPQVFADFARVCFAEAPHALLDRSEAVVAAAAAAAVVAPGYVTAAAGEPLEASIGVMQLWEELRRNRNDVEQTLPFLVVIAATYLTAMYLICPPTNKDYSAFGLDYPTGHTVPNFTKVLEVITLRGLGAMWCAICEPLCRAGFVNMLTDAQWCDIMQRVAVRGF